MSVLVVDDQAPFRTAARLVVGPLRGFEVVGEAKSGEEALETGRALRPAPRLDGHQHGGYGRYRSHPPHRDEHEGSRVILLSTYDEEDLPADARTCGAIAYVHKEHFGPDILEEYLGGGDPGRRLKRLGQAGWLR